MIAAQKQKQNIKIQKTKQQEEEQQENHKQKVILKVYNNSFNNNNKLLLLLFINYYYDYYMIMNILQKQISYLINKKTKTKKQLTIRFNIIFK